MRKILFLFIGFIFLLSGCINYFHDLSKEISNASASDAFISAFSFHPDDNPELDKEYNGNIVDNKNQILIVVPGDSGVKGLTLIPRFTAKGLVYVNGAIQTSGLSGQPFSADVVYTAVSANEKYQKSYTVRILKIDSRIYVKPDAAGNGDGSSWENAFTSLHEAIETASLFHESLQKEIWIAAGTYKPVQSEDENAFFHLVANTSYIGGFEGNETGINARNIAVNKTIISGDLGSGQSNNLFANADIAAVGRFITFDGIAFEKSAAAINAFLSPTARLIILNCAFSDIQGTAVFSFHGRRTTITNSTFDNIAANGNFGAVFINGEEISITNSGFNNITGDAVSIICSDAAIENTYFKNITAKGQALYISQNAASGYININKVDVDTVTGRGIYISSHTLYLINSVIKNCDAGEGFGGGIHIVNSGRAEISSVDINDTSAKTGGGIYYDGSAASSSLLVRNVKYDGEIIYKNHPKAHLFGNNIEFDDVIVP